MFLEGVLKKAPFITIVLLLLVFRLCAAQSFETPSPLTGKDKQRQAQTNTESINNPLLLNELEMYLKEPAAALTELRQLAISGDLLGQVRLCAIATHERFNLGVEPAEGISY